MGSDWLSTLGEVPSVFDELESRFPHLSNLATQGHVRESELRLQKEIREVEGRLQKKIKEVGGRLRKELKELDAKIVGLEGRLQEEIRQVEVNLMRAMNAQTRWMLGGLAVLDAVLKLADVLIG